MQTSSKAFYMLIYKSLPILFLKHGNAIQSPVRTTGCNHTTGCQLHLWWKQCLRRNHWEDMRDLLHSYANGCFRRKVLKNSCKSHTWELFLKLFIKYYFSQPTKLTDLDQCKPAQILLTCTSLYCSWKHNNTIQNPTWGIGHNHTSHTANFTCGEQQCPGI